MTDRPIIFSAPMVQALLAGTKTQTRRIIKPRGDRPSLFYGEWDDSYVLDAGNADWRAQDVRFAACDRMYVREAHAFVGGNDPGILITRADYPACVPTDCEGVPPAAEIRWRPSIHMPRSASRLTLLVTDVRCQRLQDISEEDAAAEGVEPPSDERYEHDWKICPMCGGTRLHGAFGDNYGVTEVDCVECNTHVKRFRHLWDSINGPDAWQANPWIVAVQFEVRHGNIDALTVSA